MLEQAVAVCPVLTRTGKPCPNRPMAGRETCFTHSEEAVEQRRRATQASAEKRKARTEGRKQASEDAKLSLTDAIRRAAAIHRDAIVESLVTAAKADGNGAAMRELLNRVDGKVTDSLNVNAGDPFTMSEEALHKWLTESDTVSDSPDSQS